MTTIIFLLILVFLIGLYFYANNNDTVINEGYRNNSNSTSRCPNMLIQKGSKFYLYNSNLAQVPGVNPIEFNNLEDYTEFLDWQRSQGIRCPVLYLQESYNAQGKRVYNIRPSVSEPQAGLPPSIVTPGIVQSTISPSTVPTTGTGIASSQGNLINESSLSDNNNKPVYPNPTLLIDATRNDMPYNKNSYPAYDQTDFYIGTTTPLDAMNIVQKEQNVSPNPMDPNWGGNAYTQELVNKGYYNENNVSIYIP